MRKSFAKLWPVNWLTWLGLGLGFGFGFGYGVKGWG